MNPRHLSIYLTMRCNMACPHCHQKGTLARRTMPDMTMERLTHLFERLGQEGLSFHTVTLTGGEPLLNPILADAVAEARRHATVVQVISNGMTEDGRMYGPADVVRVTDYGALNRWYIHKLKGSLGKRLHVCPSVHVPLPTEPVDEVSCNLLHVGVMGDKLYGCCPQALHDIGGVHVDAPLRAWLADDDPRGRSLCRTCIGNKAVYCEVAVPPTFQACIWGVEESNLIVSLRHRPTWLYKAYQAFRSRRGR